MSPFLPSLIPSPRRLVLALIAALLPTCLFAASPDAPQSRRPNVLLILTDNQSYFELGVHGHERLQTPNIDRLAAQSVDFRNFHAPPFCSPSRAALLTGRYAMRAGVHDTVGGRSILHRNEATLANYLGAGGYRTAIFGKWHLGLSYPYHPLERGFDEVFIHGGGGIGQMEDYFGNNHIDATWDHNGTMVKRKGYSTDVLFSEATRFIDESKSHPFFCFISTPATHTPWQVEPEALARIKARGVTATENELKLFSMIENIDDNVGRLMSRLDEWGIAENTIVIFATDQGVRERGAPHPRYHERRDEDNVAYDVNHQVFCMVRYSPVTRAGINTALTGIVDLTPTILDLCGLPKPGSLDGRSLRPLLTGAGEWEDERTLIVQCPRRRYREKWRNAAVKMGPWRLVGGNKLYDVAADPDQRRNVVADHPDVVARLTDTYERFWETLPSAQETLSRHILGAPQAPDVRLVCMDWYQGASPWHQLHLQRNKANGVWPVEIVSDGRYQFELRWYPREHPTPIGASMATLRVGHVTASQAIDPADDRVVFQLPLERGQYDLESVFLDPTAEEHPEWGAYFVYVSYLGP